MLSYMLGKMGKVALNTNDRLTLSELTPVSEHEVTRNNSSLLVAQLTVHQFPFMKVPCTCMLLAGEKHCSVTVSVLPENKTQ